MIEKAISVNAITNSMYNLLIAYVVSSFSPGTESSSRRLGKGSAPSDFPCSVVSALGGSWQQSELSYHSLF